jgi:alcohol dehydrogenase class IV
MEKTGILNKLQDYLNNNNIDSMVCSKVNPNPHHTDVDKICDLQNDYNPDCILGLGGTSSIDVSKIVAMQKFNGGSSWDYINLKDRPAKSITKNSLPLIVIPSTSGGGSESTPYAVITNSKTKMKKGMKSDKLYPSLVVIDPKLLNLMPRDIVINSGFDTFCQSLEAFTSKNANLMSDFFSKRSLEIIVRNFENSWRDNADLETKKAMGWASFLSGLAIGITDTNLAHAMSHPLSALYGIQHGIGVWICTFQEIQFNKSKMNNKYDFVKSLFEKRYSQKFDTLIDALSVWTVKTNTKLNLSHYGIPESSIEKLVDYSLQIGGINTNPITINKQQLSFLFQKTWKGQVD